MLLALHCSSPSLLWGLEEHLPPVWIHQREIHSTHLERFSMIHANQLGGRLNHLFVAVFAQVAMR